MTKRLSHLTDWVSHALLWLLGFVALVYGSTSVAATITATPITWNVVGLDSNNVNVGPNVFPVGVRVCASGGSASGLTAKFNWLDTPSTYITRTSAESLAVPTLAAGACQDIFHEVTIKRDAAAYDQRSHYNIQIMNGANVVASTPANREIYVEHLISQNRNAIDGIKVDGSTVAPGGSVNVKVGQTFNLLLNAHTATQGYEQLEKFLTLKSGVFQVNSVKSTYTSNSGTDPDALTKLYADGCGWQNDYTVTTGPWQYHNNYSCSGTGKYGGTITLELSVTVVGGSGTTESANALIYDFSGSSYHYNSDYGTGGINFIIGEATPFADLAITKTVSNPTPATGAPIQFSLTVTNNGPTAATGVVVTDVIPGDGTNTGYNIKPTGQWTIPSGTSASVNGQTITWTIGNLAVGALASKTLVIAVQVNNDGPYANTATVKGNESDNVPANNTATTGVTPTGAIADVGVSKTVNNNHPSVGETVTFTLTAFNNGPSTATVVTVADAIPTGYTVTNVTPSAGTTWNGSSWSIGSLANGAMATLAIQALVKATGVFLNVARISSTTIAELLTYPLQPSVFEL